MGMYIKNEDGMHVTTIRCDKCGEDIPSQKECNVIFSIDGGEVMMLHKECDTYSDMSFLSMKQFLKPINDDIEGDC